jgi:hypothetical protein
MGDSAAGAVSTNVDMQVLNEGAVACPLKCAIHTHASGDGEVNQRLPIHEYRLFAVDRIHTYRATRDPNHLR